MLQVVVWGLAGLIAAVGGVALQRSLAGPRGWASAAGAVGLMVATACFGGAVLLVLLGNSQAEIAAAGVW